MRVAAYGHQLRLTRSGGSASRFALFLATVVGRFVYVGLGFGPLDALYQTVTTGATVGFREGRPLTVPARTSPRRPSS